MGRRLKQMNADKHFVFISVDRRSSAAIGFFLTFRGSDFHESILTRLRPRRGGGKLPNRGTLQMRLVLRIALCCSLAIGVGAAQRRGGGGGRGGGGVVRGRARMGGGVFRGGGGIGRFSGFRGGYGGYGGYYGGYYSPYFYSGYGLGYGYGYGYSPWYDDYGYSSSSYPAYSYPVYQPSPNVNVVYAPPEQAQAPTTVYVERPNSLTREYDQYGQQSNRPMASTDSASPIYLIAFRDHTIRAAAAYWVEGDTLHYITQEHEQKQAALGTVDRDLSGQLNRERRVAFSLPASH